LPLTEDSSILPPVNELSANFPDTPQARRVVNEQAVKLAVAGRWQEAAALNRELIARFGDDAEVYNRLGKAFTELGRIKDARLAYEGALSVEPTNTIAKRNLARLEQANEEEPPAEPAAQMSRGLFIEEVGKAAVVQLEASQPDALGALDAGDSVELEVKGNAVNVVTKAGVYLGMIEPRAGLRLARLMGGGNLYSAAVVSNSQPPRIIVRETFQDPSQAGKVSFPKSNISDVRAYTRRNFLREDVEDLVEDEDGDDEETVTSADALPEDGWQETRIYEDDEEDEDDEDEEDDSELV
tara:strand:+ start:80 stop:970 length:891 start_codon:yes stop_codon:yes gene_type:complete